MLLTFVNLTVNLRLTPLTLTLGTALTKAMAAIISSIPEAISIMPLEIAKTSLQLDSANRFKNNMLIAMSTVYKEKGFKGFTVGRVSARVRVGVTFRVRVRAQK
jgi:hypothetical protein